MGLEIMTIKNVICDIDGVLLHDNTAVPGADRFLARIQEQGMPLVILTNYPSQTAQDLANRFSAAGLDVPESAFFTSAMATADFLKRQEGKKAYVVGEGALIHELYKAGFTITDINPDFVIVGETRSYNWDMIHKAAYFVANGARFIATNPDNHGHGFVPACGALCAPIEKITGRQPFYVGKPSPWIIRSALNKMQAHSEDTVIVGDNLRTDILAGFQAGLETVLVLTGVSTLNDIEGMPFRPTWIYPSVADIDVI
ncbi:NagD family phosphatase [Rahnella aquatilis CIP 78.65 = ATCC 33071]|uniref:Ribonucleotide monophosphatase NagD n=3 Tax=Rahnella TaxID=34037 RepID=H2IX96_RAHAC|nr:putative sugar phosphatase of HAD superfamily [Rahnella aquatilis CIP 78.65 = ATCC 33071]KFD04680.1 NagD family phosphatase [Rahnella aquatilis CIP 78.65 = ATCC 33071]